MLVFGEKSNQLRTHSGIARGTSDLWRQAHLGTQFVIILIGGMWGGAWLDKRFQSGGMFVLLGVGIGAAIGFYLIYRETQR